MVLTRLTKITTLNFSNFFDLVTRFLLFNHVGVAVCKLVAVCRSCWSDWCRLAERNRPEMGT